MQIPGVLSLIDDITLGPYSIMDADHLDPHIAGNTLAQQHHNITNEEDAAPLIACVKRCLLLLLSTDYDVADSACCNLCCEASNLKLQPEVLAGLMSPHYHTAHLSLAPVIH
jgi:hypothetical protein